MKKIFSFILYSYVFLCISFATSFYSVQSTTTSLNNYFVSKTGDTIDGTLTINHGLNLIDNRLLLNGYIGANNQFIGSTGSFAEWKSITQSTTTITASSPILISTSNNISLSREINIDTITINNNAYISTITFNGGSVLNDTQYFNTKVVKTEADFGEVNPDGSIQLLNGTIYDLQSQQVYLTKSLKMPNFSLNPLFCNIKNGFIVYDSTTPLFDTNQDYCNIVTCTDSLFYSINSGKLFNLTQNTYNGNFLLFTNCIFQGFTDLGNIDNFDLFLHFTYFIDYGYGLKFNQVYNSEIISTSFILPKGYNTNTLSLDNIYSSFFINTTKFDTATSIEKNIYFSTNALTSARVNIFGNIFTSTNIFNTNSLTQTDNRIYAKGNNGLSDSIAFASAYAVGLSSTTTITSSNVSYHLVGSWNTQFIERFIHYSTGTWVYNGIEELTVKCQANINVDPTATNETSWAGYIALNGTSVEPSQYKLTIPGSNVGVLSPVCTLKLKRGDVISINIERYSGTGNIVFTNGNIIINQI